MLIRGAPGRNGILKYILVTENDCIPIWISQMFISNDLIGKKSTMLRVIVWHRKGGRPLSEPVMTHYSDAHKGQRILMG